MTSSFFHGVPCQEWQGAKHNGYGWRRYQGRSMGAHRAAFFEANGWWPALVRHGCDNPPCVEPLHLLGGTHADNKADCVARNRHAKGSMLPQTKLNEQIVKAIREMYGESRGPGRRSTNDLTLKEIGALFSVHETVVFKIVRRQIWRHVP